MSDPVIEVSGLSVGTVGRNGRAIVKDAGFDVGAAETVALLGGTGSGKTMTARAIMGVLPPEIAILGGRISFEGRDLTALEPEERRRLRGRRIAYVPQNAKAALHPLRRVGGQMRTILRDLELAGGDEAEQMAERALASVMIQDPERVLRSHAHELSGGMAQRVAIAIALLGSPHVLIADEPTTGLDATVQEQIMRLIEDRAEHAGVSTLLITHDLAVVARFCDRVVIVDGGRVVERATVAGLFADAQSDYGRRLVAAASREATMLAGARG
jgi:ABC-type glutathione transport system ATPase component